VALGPPLGEKVQRGGVYSLLEITSAPRYGQERRETIPLAATGASRPCSLS